MSRFLKRIGAVTGAALIAGSLLVLAPAAHAAEQPFDIAVNLPTETANDGTKASTGNFKVTNITGDTYDRDSLVIRHSVKATGLTKSILNDTPGKGIFNLTKDANNRLAFRNPAENPDLCEAGTLCSFLSVGHSDNFYQPNRSQTMQLKVQIDTGAAALTGPLTIEIAVLQLNADDQLTGILGLGTATMTLVGTGPQATFPDVPVGHQFFDEINWAVESGVVAGYADGTFGPQKPVTRLAFASFAVRYLNPNAATGPCPAANPSPFTDVANSAEYCAQIRDLAAMGITTGYGDGSTFKPGARITRLAISAMTYRMYLTEKNLPIDTAAPACTAKPFPDVTTTYPFCAEIKWMADNGISTGTNGLFEPSKTSSRQATVAFLHRLSKL